MNTSTSNGWDSCAGRYDFESTHVTSPHIRYALSLVKNTMNPLSTNLLDVGSGSGVLTFSAVSFVSSIQATDFSQGMVNIISEKLKQMHYTDKITATVQNAEELKDFKDNSFDYVFCCFTLMMVPNKEKALKEMWRVLKPNGKLIITTWADKKYSQLHTLLPNCMRTATEKVKHIATGHTETKPDTTNNNAPINITTTTESVVTQPIHNFTIPLSTEQSIRDLFASSAVSATNLNILSHTDSSRTYYGAQDFWNSLQGVSPMLHTKLNAEQQKIYDEAGKEYISSTFGEFAAFSINSMSLITVATK